MQAVLNTYGAIDSATTLCGSVEAGRRLFPGVPQAPFLAGMAAGVGGSVFRFLDRKLGRGWEDEQTELVNPTETSKRTLVYTIAYMLLRSTYGTRNARVWVTFTHVFYVLVQQYLVESKSQLADTLEINFPVRPARRNRKRPKSTTAKVAIETAVKTLLDLKKRYKSATGEDYSAGRKPGNGNSSSSSSEKRKLWEEVKAQGDKVRALKIKKERTKKATLSAYSV